MLTLTNEQDIRERVHGSVVRMVSRGKESVTFLDEIDAADIAYDARPGSVKVYVTEDDRLHVRYPYNICTIDELEASEVEKEYYELLSIVERMLKEADPMRRLLGESVALKAHELNTEAGTYLILLYMERLGDAEFGFDGKKHFITADGRMEYYDFNSLRMSLQTVRKNLNLET